MDVGTRSARAALFDLGGAMGPREVEPFALASRGETHGTYRADDIWNAVAKVVRRTAHGLEDGHIVGLAFDATCSLVLSGAQGGRLEIEPAGQDTIAWFDRRATAEARICSNAGGPSLDLFGGVMSPEMQVPKLLWLKNRHPELWSQLARAEDLVDHLVSRAVGFPVRGTASLAAKWPFLPGQGGWDEVFLDRVGLPDLRSRAALPATGLAVGTSAGTLCSEGAEALGLPAGIPVASGMIDGYAGALGCIALDPDAIALVAGTSVSVLAAASVSNSRETWWGPFEDVLAPGTQTLEAGLSDAGSLLDQVIAQGSERGNARSSHAQLLSRVAELHRDIGHALGADIHILPGERGLRGVQKVTPLGAVVHGLPAQLDPDALAAFYWRMAGSLALSIDELVAGTAPERTIAAVGGLMRSHLFTQIVADATERDVLVTETVDGVLLGTAMAGAVATGAFTNLAEAARTMAPDLRRTNPEPAGVAQARRDKSIRARMARHRAEIAGV
ncbi:FGGY-family carbohydrate kinase [uncultured Maritimibacter sp.]|uniref:FGGY-family carbohydrate kinase n=1 Tax=uncultured Maritimibacter sp. TaxID=991866 RepID=UPI002607AF60|nr:FGGY-family carbohydrate kinase [uncultured Maritimibacter sp.]